MNFDYSQTYLYKLHKLTNQLDKTFDQTLRQHAAIGMSQFTLLLSIRQHQPAAQRTIADFLDLSAGAISRQVEIANQNGWIAISNHATDRRGRILSLTGEGAKMIDAGMKALEAHTFTIFDNENDQTNLMAHIDTLQRNIEDISPI